MPIGIEVSFSLLIEGPNMPNVAVNLITDSRIEEEPEKKNSPTYPRVDDSISEFERARTCSKTWSMPQD